LSENIFVCSESLRNERLFYDKVYVLW